MFAHVIMGGKKSVYMDKSYYCSVMWLLIHATGNFFGIHIAIYVCL